MSRRIPTDDMSHDSEETSTTKVETNLHVVRPSRGYVPILLQIPGPPFINEDSALGLIGALLAEQHEEWSTGRRYFDMTQYYEWKEAGERRRGAELLRIG